MREVDERLLARIWRGQWLDSAKLKTAQGVAVQVVFPGRGNGGDGPDVLDVIAALEGGELLRGDVELHVRAGDWFVHRHHLNPAYNNVVLQVTWDSDLPWVHREDGTRVPTLPLQGSLLIPPEALLSVDEPEPTFSTECKDMVSALGHEETGRVLDRVGEERFKGKGAAFQGELACYPAQEVLYQGLMRGLGYSRNQEPFVRLSRLLPLSTLRALVGRTPDDTRSAFIAACLLGRAGLLSSQLGALLPSPVKGVGEVLEELWIGSELAQEMEATDWRVSRIRPSNHPANRMMAMGLLISRTPDLELLGDLQDLLLKSYFQRSPSMLEDGLTVPGYLGKGRVREMLASIVLPYFWGLGEGRETPGLARAALDLFSSMPKGQGNRVTREMEAQLLGAGSREVINSLARQQGLIHLFKGTCRYGFCAGCPLGQAVREQERAVEAAPITEEVGR